MGVKQSASKSLVWDQIETKKLLDALLVLGQTSSLDFPQALLIVLEQLETVVGYDSAAIFLVEDGHASVVAARGFPDMEKVRKVSLDPAEDALFQEMSRTKSPSVIPDVRKNKRFRALGGTEYVQGWLGAPLVARGEVIGFLTLDSHKVGHFSKVDAELVSVFASHAAIAIEVARSYEHQRRRAQELASLHDVGLSIVSDLELSHVLERIAQNALTVLDADVVTLYQYFQERDEFVVPPTVAGELRQPVAMSRRVYEDDVVARIVRAGESHYASDAEKDGFLLGSWGAAVPARGGQPETLRFTPREGIRSSAGVLLKVADEAVGVMFVNYREHRWFTKDEKRLAQTFANQAAIAIKNARLFDWVRSDLDRRVEEVEALAEIDGAITISDLDTVLSKILETAVRIIAVDDGSLLLVDESGEYLVPRAMYGTPWQPGSPGKLRIGEMGVQGWVARHKRTARIADVHSRGWEGIYVEVNPETSSELTVPLLDESGQLIGIINLESPQLQAFSEDDQRLLEALAKQAVIAIQNQRRYEAQQRARRELEVISKIDKAISSTLDWEEVISLILDEGLKLVDAPFGNLMLYDKVKGDLWMAAGRGTIGAREGARREIGEGIVGLVAQEKKALRVSDVTEASWRDIYVPFIEGIRSELAVPMFYDGILVGVLNAESPEIGGFSEDDQRLLEALAAQAVIAIQNAEQAQELARALERFQRLYEAAREIIQAELNERSILGAALRIGMERTHAFSASARLLDESGKWLEPVEHLGETYDGAWKPIAIGKRVHGWVAGHRKVLLVDVHDLPTEIGAWHGHPETRWKVVVPIIAGNAYFGNLGFDCTSEEWFEEDDVRLIEGIADQAAAALQRLRERRRAEEAELRKMSMDNLTMLQTLRTNLLHGFGARRLVPFRAMAGALQRELDKGIDQIDREVVYEMLNNIRQAAQESFEDLRKIVDLPTRAVVEQATLVDMNLQVQGAYRYTIDSKPEDVQVDFFFAEDVPTIRIDPLQLSVIFENLFANAYEALKDWGGERRLSVTTFKAQGDKGVTKVGVKFSNTGPPVPDDMARRLFKEPIGEGMGLYTSAWVISLCGGMISLTENEPGRVTFHVEFDAKEGQ